jgi:FG-GAP-like repeat
VTGAYQWRNPPDPDKGGRMRRTMILVAALAVFGVAASDSADTGFGPVRTLLILEDTSARPVMADFDGDGLLDVATVSPQHENVTIHQNDGEGRLEVGPTSAAGLAGLSLAAGDLDGNGTVDLVVHGLTDPPGLGHASARGVLLNDGTGRFSVTVVETDLDFDEPLLLVDVDRDGDLDIVHPSLHTADPRGLHIELNDGAGSFGETGFIPCGDLRNPVFADVDGDDRVDLLGVDTYDGIVLYRNRGPAGFESSVVIDDISVDQIVPEDVDGDDRIDLVAPFDGPGTKPLGIYVYRGRGDGTFEPREHQVVPGTSAATTHRCLVAFDLDGDGDSDLVSDLPHDRVTVLKNRGDGTFHASHEFRIEDPVHPSDHLAFAHSARKIQVGNVNGDSRPDIVVFARGGRTYLLTGSDQPVPIVDSISPDSLRSGDLAVVTVTGRNLGTGARFDFGPDVIVDRVRWVSEGRYDVTIIPEALWDESPRPGRSEFADLIAETRDGMSTMVHDAIESRSFWDFTIATAKGKIDDSTRSLRDRLKVECLLSRGPDSWPMAEIVEQGLRILVGDRNAPYELIVPEGATGWDLSEDGERLKYRSPRGTRPKVRLWLDNTLNSPRYRLEIKKFDLPRLPAQAHEVWMTLEFDDLRGSGSRKWTAKTERKLRLK